jgi:hypothetical protein
MLRYKYAASCFHTKQQTNKAHKTGEAHAHCVGTGGDMLAAANFFHPSS